MSTSLTRPGLCAQAIFVVLLLGCSSASKHVPSQEQNTTSAGTPGVAYTCNGAYRFVAAEQGDHVWLFLPDRTLNLPSDTPQAQYSDGNITFRSEDGKARLTTAGETYRCQTSTAPSPWEDERLESLDYRAKGNEPGWLLELRAQGKSTLIVDYGNKRYRFKTPAPQLDEDSALYRAQSNERSLTIHIRNETCQDFMSGAPYDTSVRITVDRRLYEGCGRFLR